MPHSSLTHPPFEAFFYLTVLVPSSHYSIIYILSLICANVVIICKCHTKTGCYSRHFAELGGDSPRTLLQLAVIWKHFWKVGEMISPQESPLVTAPQVPEPKTRLIGFYRCRCSAAIYRSSVNLANLANVSPLASTCHSPGPSHNWLNHDFLLQLTCSDVLPAFHDCRLWPGEVLWVNRHTRDQKSRQCARGR